MELCRCVLVIFAIQIGIVSIVAHILMNVKTIHGFTVNGIGTNSI